MLEILQVAQRVDDLDRAIAFYAELLGEQPAAVFAESKLAFFNAGLTRIMLTHEAPSTVLYLRVDDARERVEAMRADGVRVIAEPHVIHSHTTDAIGPNDTDEVMAFVEDSEGNPVALCSFEARHTP